MKKTTNKLWISSLLAITVGLSVANGEMLRSKSQEVVYDSDTKLMWQDNSEAKTIRKNWQDAMDYCQNLNLAGFDDWKQPSNFTLEALYPKKVALHNVDTYYYWGSSGFRAYFGSDANGHNYGYKNNDYYCVRCVRDSGKFDILTYSSFMERLKTLNSAKNSIVLNSSRDSESKLFLVKKDGKNYFGTKNELIKQLVEYSKNPFKTIQKLTQQQLNEYLTITTVASLNFPKSLNLVKDEFESNAEFNKKVESRKANIQTAKREFLFNNLVLVMGTPKLSNPVFDADTNTMFVDLEMSNADWKKKVAIKMEDRSLAKNFKNSIDKATSKVTFGYENDGLVLQNIEVGFEQNQLIATLSEKDFRPESVSIALLQNSNSIVLNIAYNESNQVKGLKYNDDLAPLLKNMKAEKQNPKNWLFAVAIENYDEADAVIYAKNSAKSLISAMQKRLGISERNTYALIDEKATGGAIKGQLERLLENVKEGDNIYFYYSGHGIPSSTDGEAFILPKDVIADYVSREKEFMARNIYKKLSDSKAGKVVAFVDSCYSGKTDGISNIKGVAAGVFKTKKVEFDKSKMVVLTAGTNGQFSNAYTEKGQRLFSYFVTKALINRPTLDINSLYQEISVGVKDESFKLGDNKRQEPQIEGNVEMGL